VSRKEGVYLRIVGAGLHMSMIRRTLTPQWQWLERFILLVDNDKKESDLTVSIARRVELLGVMDK
jgi:hypothetical protein